MFIAACVNNFFLHILCVCLDLSVKHVAVKVGKEEHFEIWSYCSAQARLKLKLGMKQNTKFGFNTTTTTTTQTSRPVPGHAMPC
jgi:hypothetical protein